MPLSISKIRLKSPIILAPMAGYTDSPFRRLCARHGAGMTYTELISSEGIIRRQKKTLEYFRFTEEEKPIAIQIFGGNPEVMAEAAVIAESFSPDAIDINMGCCAPKITGSMSGAALLRNTENLSAVASAVVQAVKTPVSAKIRIGWDFSSLNYRTTVKILADSGISHIAVHGRTNSQKYSGRANWDIISEIASFSDLPVIGSGDIVSYDDAIEKLNSSGCSAVMIGRHAIGNPWIFSGEIPDHDEIKKMILEHMTMMTEHFGEHGIIMARKHLVKYIHHFRNSSAARQIMVHAENMDDIVKAFNLF